MTITKAAATKPAAPKKTRVTKKPTVPKQAKQDHPRKTVHEHASQEAVPAPNPAGRYVFATGRRKSAVANVRLFSGKGDSLVNKKPLEQYFNYSFYQQDIAKPFSLTGLEGQYFAVCQVSGGGPHAQAQAVRHGIAIALSRVSEEVRRVLKKNGLLTRDPREKERKKPGLKRARRSPQWAKR